MNKIKEMIEDFKDAIDFRRRSARCAWGHVLSIVQNIRHIGIDVKDIIVGR